MSKRNALLCKCLSGLMQSNCYLQRDLASIHSITCLHAILTADKEVMVHVLRPRFIAKSVHRSISDVISTCMNFILFDRNNEE